MFIWAIGDAHRLDRRVQAAVASPRNKVFVSAATAWEIAIKQALGRLTFPLDRFDDIIQRMGFEPLPIETAHGIAAGRLPRHHDDPFDRMLIAQAQQESLTLVSIDQAVDRYDIARYP